MGSSINMFNTIRGAQLVIHIHLLHLNFSWSWAYKYRWILILWVFISVFICYQRKTCHWWSWIDLLGNIILYWKFMITRIFITIVTMISTFFHFNKSCLSIINIKLISPPNSFFQFFLEWIRLFNIFVFIGFLLFEFLWLLLLIIYSIMMNDFRFSLSLIFIMFWFIISIFHPYITFIARNDDYNNEA